MIYTLTANPAIDYNITCDALVPDAVTRTRDAVYTPNGKGLNVSFTLAHYGVASTILGFFAGFSGRYIVDGARALGCAVEPVWIDGVTRVNVFLTSDSGEYKLVNAGAPVTAVDEARMLELIGGLDDLALLVVSGSMPPGVREGFLPAVIERVRARGGEVVLDISSSQLARLLAQRPLLIKPNDDELREIFGFAVTAGEDAAVAEALRELHRRGARYILLTLGSGGAYFGDGERLWYARAKMPVRVLSTACAGDASLGAFLARWRPGEDPEQALALSMATGANVVECPGLGDFAKVDEYLRHVEVQRVR
ncbi:1-phosphofructokinase family hexose kinase [Enorma phocaeensis]|uniref:1-phosphofructokinase family hexose kinase n=1 Tax=Enorma phocaeensis TaxID=1871019 RepID=UPI000C84ED23|nr:1-phosphofructokinase family hexose kinase [Enorma phocaeensis]